RLELNDVLCVIGHARDLPALSKIFSTTSVPRHLNSRQFFGNFVLEGSALLDEVGTFYGFEVPAELSGLTLAQFCTRQLGGRPVVGDQTEWQGMCWVVAEVVDDEIRKVGLKWGNEKDDQPPEPMDGPSLDVKDDVCCLLRRHNN